MNFKMIVALALLLITLVACDSSKEGTGLVAKGESVPLDEEQLKQSLAVAWSNKLTVERARKGQQTEDVVLGADSIEIAQKKQVQVGSNAYYAVKVKLKQPKKYMLPPEMSMVVDPTGNLVFAEVVDIKSGHEAVLKKAPEITKIKLSDSVESMDSIVIQNLPGDNKVTFIADPFCSYSRRAYAFICQNSDKLGRVELVQNPLYPRAGSDVAAWVVEYAIEKRIGAKELLDFTFTSLKPVQPLVVNGKGVAKKPVEVGIEILEQYKKRFPVLFSGEQENLQAAYNSLANQYARKADYTKMVLASSGIRSAPLFIINGEVVRGMKKEKLAAMLGIKVAKTAIQKTGGS